MNLYSLQGEPIPVKRFLMQITDGEIVMVESIGIRIPGLDEWLKSLFKSSGIIGRLIQMDECLILPHGEHFSHIAIGSSLYFEKGNPVRMAAFSFAKGLCREDLFGTEFIIYLDSSGAIDQICEVTHVSDNSVEKRALFDIRYSSPMFTPRDVYMHGISRFESIVLPLIGRSGDILNHRHPLLNRNDEPGWGLEIRGSEGRS